MYRNSFNVMIPCWYGHKSTHQIRTQKKQRQCTKGLDLLLPAKKNYNEQQKTILF